jgi:hypothetical protein
MRPACNTLLAVLACFMVLVSAQQACTAWKLLGVCVMTMLALNNWPYVLLLLLAAQLTSVQCAHALNARSPLGLAVASPQETASTMKRGMLQAGPGPVNALGESCQQALSGPGTGYLSTGLALRSQA